MRSHRETPLPTVYLVPREGRVERLSVYDRDGARSVRAELELLRRIRLNAHATQAARKRTSIGTIHLAFVSADDYSELRQIMDDAAHPLVESMIALVDEEFADVREEIAMPVVNDEAQKIVDEAGECGAIRQEDSAGAQAKPDITDSMTVDDALALAEADLAAAAGKTPETTAAVEPAAPSKVSEEPSNSEGSDATLEQCAAVDDAAVSESETSPAGSAEDVETASEPDAEPEPCAESKPCAEPDSEPEPSCVVDAPDPVEAPEVAGQADAVESTRETESASTESSVEAGSSSEQIDHGDADAADMGGQVEQAVSVIEQGIHGLAALVRSELHEGWARAKQSLEEVDSSREQLDQGCQSTKEAVQEIARLREEAQIARDDANIARREAKLLRDATKLLKERAEANAAAAELAADQATREANAIRNLAAQTR